MQRSFRRLDGPSALRNASALWLSATALLAHAGVMSRDLERAMAARGTHADTAVILRFADPLDIAPLTVADRRLRDNRLFTALRQRGARNRAVIDPLLVALGAQGVKDLWIINAVAATLPAIAVKRLAAEASIDRIDLDSFVQGGRSQRTPGPHTPPLSAEPATPATSNAAAPGGAVVRARPPWNIAAVHAPELWALGYTGQGVVVATMDTGADRLHPDLQHSWRGGTNSWFDPHGQEAAPYDALGHGTQVLGVIVAGAARGVAPDARWIAVRLYDAAGRASMSDIHRAFQWLIDPDGDAATIDAPDVVNASWSLVGRGVGSCIAEFGDDVRMLRNAGIAVVFAAGNDGPAPGTSNSPGNNPGVLSVGAVDGDLGIARQSSRGPSACDGAPFPSLVAPGANIRTADLSHGGLPSTTLASGSSLAAPHAAGVLALLAGAFPSASVAELEAALLRGAAASGARGADTVYGHGLVDALASFHVLRDAH